MWKLRVLNGLSQNAECKLAIDNEWIIGSDPLRADIVLLDTDIEPLHFKIKNQNNQLIIVKVYSDKKPYQKRKRLNDGDAITANIPIIICGIKIIFENHNIKNKNNFLISIEKRKFKLAIGVAVVVIIVFMSNLIYHKKSINTDKLINEFFVNNELSCLKITQQSNNLFEINGIIDSDDKKNTLIRFLNDNQVNYKLDITLIEEYIHKIEKIFVRLNYPQLSINTQKQCDTLIITGFFSNIQKDKDDLLYILKRDISFLPNIIFENSINDDNVKKVIDLLKKHKLIDDLISIRLQSNTLKIELDSLSDIVNLNNFNNAIKIKKNTKHALLVILKNKNNLQYSFKIKSVSLGKTRYLKLNNGQKYYEGSILPGEIYLEKINNDSITIRKNDHFHTIRYTKHE